MKQLETAIVNSGLVRASQSVTARALRAKARKSAQARRTALIVQVMPTGALFLALAKARKGKRSTRDAKAAIFAAQSEIRACNVVLRGAI